MNPVGTDLIRVRGMVQGVGFRPFVSRLAKRFGLTGSVANKGSYVEIHLQGKPEARKQFLAALEPEAPERSAILRVDVSCVQETPATEFTIIESIHEEGDIFVSPDIATCPRCEAELYDPANRRYRHPFINCTACGPRLTILEAMPYDRERTSMHVFPMCGPCAAEYHDPATRRYDAQPVCCPDCGPEVYLVNRPERGAAAIRKAREALIAGRIVAVKGIGGFHLACNAHDAAAVRRLRELKHRPAKPFAVMMKNLETVRRECECSAAAENLLSGHQKPILLLQRKDGGTLPAELAPGNPTLGVMLPYAPVQMLLFRNDDDLDAAMPDALVMTSGNVSGAPICRSDEDALREIAGFCDLMLSHNRKILLRADDSVMMLVHDRPLTVRRSRGCAPLPFLRSGNHRGEVLGVGGELKNTFCLAKDALYYPSPYIGDMADLRTAEALKESIRRMEELLEIRPRLAACDLHPQYFTTRLAEESGLPVLKVQHHFAHILSCMAENDTTGPVIGLALDGTGYGTDGTIWGGEILHCTYSGFIRSGSIAPFLQAGGDASAREGWRIAAALLRDALGDQAAGAAARLNLCTETEFQVLSVMLEKKLNCVASTSAGRLFDAASAILGLVTCSTFEGEAAMALEFAAMRHRGETMDFVPDEPVSAGKRLILRTDVLMANLIRARLAGGDPAMLALAFHRGLAKLLAAAACRVREQTGTNICALSGGCFQNRTLLQEVVRRLSEKGFQILTHALVPPNDGGIALGQAAAAMEHLKED